MPPWARLWLTLLKYLYFRLRMLGLLGDFYWLSETKLSRLQMSIKRGHVLNVFLSLKHESFRVQTGSPPLNVSSIFSMKTPNSSQEVTVWGERGKINVEYFSQRKLRHLTCWFHRPGEEQRPLPSVHKYLGPVPRTRNSQVPTPYSAYTPTM